jgi:hypothetical protein
MTKMLLTLSLTFIIGITWAVKRAQATQAKSSFQVGVQIVETQNAPNTPSVKPKKIIKTIVY